MMMSTDKDIATITDLLKDLFEISSTYRQNQNIVFSLTTPYEPAKVLKHIKERLKLAGYQFKFDDSSEVILLTIDPITKKKIPPLNIILFFVTLFTVYVIPVLIKNLVVTEFDIVLENTFSDLAKGDGIIFTLALISILFVHEMGHFVASRRRNIITSWPYFIPAPNFIGTFGAIIKSKSPFWNRRDLIEVGAWGPIAGWVVAFFWLMFGLTQTEIISADQIIPGEMAFSMEGESLLMRILTLNIVGTAPEGMFYRLGEAAFAGWVGMLVTAINLLPIGQLDGGHILYGVLKQRQHYIGKIAMVGLVILGFQSTVWWVFAVFGFVFGVNHPPTLDDRIVIPREAKILALVSALIFFLSFTPIPFQ